MEKYFKKFRENIIGIDKNFKTPFGNKKLIYADWTASGRLYRPIEELLINEIGPFVGNTHTETSVTGSTMTKAYHKAIEVVKNHVGADENDALISSGTGMTGAVIKFQRILGFKIHEKYTSQINIPEDERPVVFITHMEHHSNQTSWEETIADVEIINPTSEGLVDIEHFKKLLEKYENRKIKIAAVTACSNVTGIVAPYHEIAEIIHDHGGHCFVDFACSAPYVEINMHPENKKQKLDAVFFSPHKFLGGPGTSGVAVFDSKLYEIKIPDEPGGGTVKWTNPWGGHRYYEKIEAREDGGTPGFLQMIKTALAIRLKESMGVANILKREHELIKIIWKRLDNIPNFHVMQKNVKDRLGIFSFYIDGLHYNLGVRLLNDLFGIQTRGGCSCAGTYGHYLFGVTEKESKHLTDMINKGDLSEKPGWIRLSIHPTMPNEEIEYILNSIENLSENWRKWKKYYDYDKHTNDFSFKGNSFVESNIAESWF